MSKSTTIKSTAQNNTSSHDEGLKPHKHSHKTGEIHNHAINGARPHPLTAFFGCCLGDEPAPLSAKIQSLREQIPTAETQEIHLKPGQIFTITKDLIIGDILTTFPQTKSLIEDLHPLGLLSPTLYQTSIEMFFADLNLDTDEICLQLTKIIK